MAHFLKNGNTFDVTNEANIDIRNELPVGTYSIMTAMNRGFYLEQQPDIVIDHKVYGDAQKNSNRIVNTFFDRKASTGVILQGEKGSGKTMLAKLLSNDLRKEGVVTLLVNSAFAGEAFNTFLSSITQPALVIFDEFEKVYDPERQNNLLTLFDGTHSGHKLFVVALNDYNRLSSFMKNRPGRFFYSFTYDGLEESFVREYCEDNLLDKSKIDTVVNFSSTFNKFNFDMLKAMVEEMNRYNEGVSEVIKYLNVKPTDSVFNLQIDEINGLKENYEGYELTTKSVHANPLVTGFSLYVEKNTDDDYDDDYIEFAPEHLVRMNNGRFVFDNGKVSISMSKMVNKKSSYLDMIEW